MPTGTVKWFRDDKGFGFITPDPEFSGQISQDLFVHYSEIEGQGYRSLAEGAKVEFEVADGEKGPKATGVRAI